MQVHYKSVRIPMPILALFLSNQLAFAGRLVRFELSIDDKVVLQASTGDEGADADTVWRYLKRLEFVPVKRYKVAADHDDPMRATLKGKVVIQSYEGGRAEVAQLQLIREMADAPWKLAPPEVERTFQSRAKPLRLTVSIGGKAVLLNAITSPWATGADAVWQNLRQVELRPFQQNKIEADSANPLRATLKGKVIIEASYGGQAEMTELKLVREKANSPWKIDSAEIERTVKGRAEPK